MARPQPVTATVTKPDWMKVHGTIHRSFSFDSTGSTASLLSVLDHDSFVESDMEMPEVAEANSPNDYQQQQEEIQNSFFEDLTHNTYSKEESENVERDCHEESITDTPWSISPWEKWLVEKEKEKREQRQKERAQKTLEEVSQIDKEHVKHQKKLRESENTFRWIQEKDLAEKLRIRQEKEEQKLAMQDEARKKKEISEQANKKFAEWLQKKKEEEKATKRAEIERKQAEEENRRKKEALAKEKYNEWKKRAMKSKVKPTTQGLGYLSGKLTDYHDRTSNPQPSFYNPIPWKPLAIPKAKTEKRPKTSKSSTRRM